jgi:hypothetical protein
MAGPLTPLIPLLPAIGKGLFWTGTAAGTAGGVASGYDWFNGIGDRARKDIVREGPDSFGDYNIPLHLKPFIDEDSLDDSRNKYVMDQAKKDVADLQGLDPSLQLTNGMTGADFKKKYAKQIRAAQLKQSIEETEAIASAQYNSPTAVDERAVRDQNRSDVLREQSLTRQDTNNRYLHESKRSDARMAHTAEQNRLDRRQQQDLSILSGDREMKIAEMQSDLSEKRMDYDRETRRIDKRQQAIASLMSGLGSLGGAFAL